MTLSEPDDPTLSRIAAGRTDLVFDHVGAGHAATAHDGDGLSLLYWCARYGDVSAMRFLLAQTVTSTIRRASIIDAVEITQGLIPGY